MTDDPARTPRKLSDVGGTSGGFGTFLFGLALLVVGAYLFIDRVSVHAWGGHHYGGGISPFAMTLIPIFLGVLVLFFDARIWLGWLGILGGLVWMIFGIVARSNFVFRATSLTMFLFMLACFAGGLGLIFRALKPR